MAQREIKFRAWDKEAKRLGAVAHLDNLLTAGTMVVIRVNSPGSVQKIEKDLEEGAYELMQFTGLHDKNGKEIYEGDIIQIRDKWDDPELDKEVGTVFYQNGAYWGLERLLGIVASYCKVIGNIYENPELLNEMGR